MFTVLLVALVFNSASGELQSVAAAKFETAAECRIALKEIPAPPVGLRVKGYCIEPRIDLT